MAKLVDLKRTKQEREKHSKPEPFRGDDYPYGLSVTLGHDELEKLGMKTLPKAGTKIKLHAHAHVKSTEDRTEDGGKRRRSMTLELRHMALEGGGQGATDDSGESARGSKLKGARAAMDKALGGKGEPPEDEGDDE